MTKRHFVCCPNTTRHTLPAGDAYRVWRTPRHHTTFASGSLLRTNGVVFHRPGHWAPRGTSPEAIRLREHATQLVHGGMRASSAVIRIFLAGWRSHVGPPFVALLESARQACRWPSESTLPFANLATTPMRPAHVVLRTSRMHPWLKVVSSVRVPGDIAEGRQVKGSRHANGGAWDASSRRGL